MALVTLVTMSSSKMSTDIVPTAANLLRKLFTYLSTNIIINYLNIEVKTLLRLYLNLELSNRQSIGFFISPVNFFVSDFVIVLNVFFNTRK